MRGWQRHEGISSPISTTMPTPTPTGCTIWLVRSKAVLEAGLNKRVEAFAYPYGDCGVNAQDLGAVFARAGYRAACLYGGGPNPVPGASPYLLTRIAMGPDTDLDAALGRG